MTVRACKKFTVSIQPADSNEMMIKTDLEGVSLPSISFRPFYNLDFSVRNAVLWDPKQFNPMLAESPSLTTNLSQPPFRNSPLWHAKGSCHLIQSYTRSIDCRLVERSLISLDDHHDRFNCL